MRLNRAGFVGADPAGLIDLAGSVEFRSVQLHSSSGITTGILDRRDWLDAAGDIAGTLRRVAADMGQRADQLRWRATTIQTAQHVELGGSAGPHLHLFRLAEFAALAAFDVDTLAETYERWRNAPSIESLAELAPQQVREAFLATAPSLAEGLARNHPELIGALDGAPLELRYLANRVLLRRRIEELECQIEEMRNSLVSAWRRWIGPAWLTSWFPVAGLRDTAIRHLQVQIDVFRRWLDEDRQILDFDPTGDGRVVEVFGDLSTAEWVGVIVPGMANDLDGFNDVGGVRADASGLFEAAAASHNAVATIAWLGYDTPDGADAALLGAATTGAPALQRFIQGIDPGSQTVITVIAHSYGSVLAGIAARRGLAADNLVFVGSPGTTLSGATEASLRPGGRVWAGLAKHDPISSAISPAELPPWWLPVVFAPAWFAADMADGAETLWHGPNPMHADFGALPISTEGSTGHSSYFEGESLRNLARIMLGQYEEAAPE